MKSYKEISIIHFNDVYQIQGFPHKPQGGAARFAQKVKELSEDQPLVLFSGDAYSPSLLSIQLKGKQMVEVLNQIGVQISCLGNHDLDFGLETFINLNQQCNFPWIISNLNDKATGKPLGGLQEYIIMEKNEIKIGIMGIMEPEWLDTLNEVDPQDLTYIDFIERSNQLSQHFRSEGCQIVIALTHMRVENDQVLAKSALDIDLILGGHDHCCHVSQPVQNQDVSTLMENTYIQNIKPNTKVNGPLIVKSGTDFKNLSKINIMHFNEIEAAQQEFQALKDNKQSKRFYRNNIVMSVNEYIVDDSVQEDQKTNDVVEYYMKDFRSKLDIGIGYTLIDLEGRFNKIRTQETNLGNFMCDLLLEYTESDIALINSGTFRSDMIHVSGQFYLKDLVSILPMNEELVVIELPGKNILNALENSVSQYPKFEGRFAQVSGISFSYDPNKPPGSRIRDAYVYKNDLKEPLDPQQNYKLATKEYLYTGKDGYDALKEGKVVMEPEMIPILSQLLKQHFIKLEVLSRLNVFKMTQKQLSLEEKEAQKEQNVKTFIDKLKKQASREQPTIKFDTKADNEIVRQASQLLERQQSQQQNNGTRTLSRAKSTYQYQHDIYPQKIEKKENLCKLNSLNQFAINPQTYNRINLVQT